MLRRVVSPVRLAATGVASGSRSGARPLCLTVRTRHLCSAAPQERLTPKSAVASAVRAADSAKSPQRPSDASQPIRIYRLAQIRVLRALLRVKIVQLGLGVGVLLPALHVYASGGSLSLVEGGTLAAVVGGTLVAGGTISWYCERLVGEIAWLPASESLRISTLTMWGHRRDVEWRREHLIEQLGFAERLPHGVTAVHDLLPPPSNSFAPWKVGDTTYLLVWGRKHVQHPGLLLPLIEGIVPAPDGSAVFGSAGGGGGLPVPGSDDANDDSGRRSEA